MDTVYTIYESQVKPLPVAGRLQLMQLIMEDLAESAPRWVVEMSDAWSHEDLSDLLRASLLYADHVLADEETNAEPG